MIRRRRPQQGFTLIEILVVVAIVAIVAALAVPVAKRVLMKAERSKMLATLDAISDDQALYQRDHGTFYPAAPSFFGWSFVTRIYRPETPVPLEGQNLVIPGSPKRYAYYIYRFEPFYPEPLIYAYKHRVFGNDLDGDPYPDMWIKSGSGPAQCYYDDLTDTRNRVEF